MKKPRQDERDEKAGATCRVWVVELDDHAWQQKRRERPNLHVGITIIRTDLQEHLEKLQCSGRGRGPIKEHGVAVREDLITDLRWMTRLDAEAQRQELIRTLGDEGYTVNGDNRVWRVYAIELSDELGRRRARGEWLYVGETSIHPRARFKQHKGGGKLAAKVVQKHGLFLRPDLYEREPWLYSAAASKNAEKALASKLKKLGYSIKGGH